MEWKIKPETDPALTGALAQHLSTKEAFPPLLTQILISRGLSNFEDIRSFLRPVKESLHDPKQLKGIEDAKYMIINFIKRGEKILLYGDYDVDGTTSVALLKLFFQDYGFDFPFYSPNRFEEGYGLSYKGIDFAAAQGINLIIAMDCGTKEAEKIKYAKTRGIEIIVCDHHQPGIEPPPAVAFINPKQKGCPYPFKELSACGLAMKLAQYLEVSFQEEGLLPVHPVTGDVFDRYCDLVALSTACDLVPLIGENRVILAKGLEKLREKPLPGIKELMTLSSVSRPWFVEDLVFFLGPRINSAGRKDHAHAAIDLLIGKGNLETFAQNLEEKNEWRKEMDASVTAEALEMIHQTDPTLSKMSTVLYHPEWHKGVIGIVASRLIEKIYRPTLMMTLSEGKVVGSARSIEGLDLYDALEMCRTHLLQFGGHMYAAGFTLEEKSLPEFTEAFEAAVRKKFNGVLPKPFLEIDGTLDFAYLTPRFVRLLQLLAPFGPQNPEPVFKTGPVKISDAAILKGEHLRLQMFQGANYFEGIGFGLAKKWTDENPESIEVAYQPQVKTWNEKSYIQLKIKDFRKVS